MQVLLIQVNVRALVDQQILSPQKQSYKIHAGCIEKMGILIQELQSLAETLRLKVKMTQIYNKKSQILYKIKQEIYIYLFKQNNQGNEELIQKLEMEWQNLEKFRKRKEQQFGQLEMESNKVHQDLKYERLKELDRYQSRSVTKLQDCKKNGQSSLIINEKK